VLTGVGWGHTAYASITTPNSNNSSGQIQTRTLEEHTRARADLGLDALAGMTHVVSNQMRRSALVADHGEPAGC
jgi:hypothetical protein